MRDSGGEREGEERERERERGTGPNCHVSIAAGAKGWTVEVLGHGEYWQESC